MKQCSKCKLQKELTEFYKHKKTNDNLRPECKDCGKAHSREYYSNNLEEQRLRVRQKRANNPEQARENSRRYRNNNPNWWKKYINDPEVTRIRVRKSRKKHLAEIKTKEWIKQGIKITYNEYQDLLKTQNNKCAICEKPTSELKRMLNVDHDHKNGMPRGLLCFKCNSAIGKLGDTYQSVLKAAKYLEKYEMSP